MAMTFLSVTRAIVLAAGRGERMRPLTDHVPKPLLPVRGKPLMVWHLEALASAGVQDVVVNGAWLEETLPQALGDGSRWGLRLHYSFEQRDHGGALETAGGIAKALPHLARTNDGLFWMVSGDVFLPGFTFDARMALQAFAQDPQLEGWLWMAPNAPHHPSGDFWLMGQGPQGRLARHEPAQDAKRPGSALADEPAPTQKLTWASVALFRASLFKDIPAGQRMPAREVLGPAMDAGRLGGQCLSTPWTDVGTPERLAELQISEA